jgi:hypothetical protein
MTSDPADWHQALARVSGQLVRGEERAKTQALLEYLGVPITDRAFGGYGGSCASLDGAARG